MWYLCYYIFTRMYHVIFWQWFNMWNITNMYQDFFPSSLSIIQPRIFKIRLLLSSVFCQFILGTVFSPEEGSTKLSKHCWVKSLLSVTMEKVLTHINDFLCYHNGSKRCSCIRCTPKKYLCLRFLYGNSIYTDGQFYFWCLVSLCLPKLLVKFQFTNPFLHHLNALWLVHFCTP